MEQELLSFPSVLADNELDLRVNEWKLMGIGVLRNDKYVVLITGEKTPGPRCEFTYYKRPDGLWHGSDNHSVVYCPDGGYWCSFGLEKECSDYFGLHTRWVRPL